MTVQLVVAVVSSLALVVAAIVLLAKLLPGTLRGVARRPSGGKLEVLERAGIAQRQGVAVVRAGSKVALVSFGDGGVSFLMELDPEDVEDDSEDTPDGPDAPFADLIRRIASRAGPPGALAADGGHPTTGSGRFHPGNLWRRVQSVMRIATVVAVAMTTSATPAFAVQTPGATSVQTQDLVDAVVGAATSAASAAQSSDAASAIAAGGQAAPAIDLRLGRQGEDGLRLTGPVGTVVFVGFLTLLPTLLLLMTSFTRILIVLHLLKQAIGTQTAPPAHLLAALALLLTGYVMAPTISTANETALVPWMDGEIEEAEMLRRSSMPFREFMLASVRERDLATFLEMRPDIDAQTADDIPLVVLTTAFATSELRNAFQMGFAVFLPFVVIDIVVASVLMSMGMFMLPPVMVSLPFKLLLFVLVDGWSLVMGSLVQSFP